MTPLILSTEVNLTAGAMLAPADEKALKNPYNRPMWIREISIANAVPNVTRIKFQLGRQNLTNNYVPIWNLGSRLDSSFDSAMWTWRLPKPLFIPQGEYLQPTFWVTDVGAVASTVRITYTGHSFDIGELEPTINAVPWVTSFIGAARLVGSNYFENSTEKDIFNPYDTPLHVQRFIGRLNQSAAIGGTGNDENYSGFYNGANVRIFDSLGKIVVRDRTPMGLVFAGDRRTWDAHGVLPPHGFYTIYMDELYADVVEDGTPGNYLQAMISMIGYHEVAL